MDPAQFFDLLLNNDGSDGDDDDVTQIISDDDDFVVEDAGLNDDSDGDSDVEGSSSDAEASAEAGDAPGESARIVPLRGAKSKKRGIEKLLEAPTIEHLCKEGIEASEGTSSEEMKDDQCDVGTILDSCFAGLVAAASPDGEEEEKGEEKKEKEEEEKEEEDFSKEVAILEQGSEVVKATAGELVRAVFYAEGGSAARFRAAFRAVAVPCPVCKEQWSTPTLTYTCYDCQKDPSAVMCKDCFDFQLHAGHRYVSVMAFSGCCDCGDATAWDPATFCAKHGAQHALAMDALVARAPAPYAAHTVAALRTLFARVVACLEAHSKPPEAGRRPALTRAERTVRASSIAAAGAALCVVAAAMKEAGEVLGALVAHALTLPPAEPVQEVKSVPGAAETVANTSVLDYLVSYAAPRPLGALLSSVVYPLIHMPGFRPLLATTLARHYVWAAERFAPLSKYYNESSVQRYLVQLATVPASFGRAMPYADALRCLFRALGHVFRKTPVRVVAPGARRYLMTARCVENAERVIADVMMISKTHHFRECLAAHPDLAVELQAVLWDAAAPFQFAVVIPKQFGEHIALDKISDLETATLMVQIELLELWSDVCEAGTASASAATADASAQGPAPRILHYFRELAERAQKILRRQYEWDAGSGLIRYDGRSVTTFFPLQMLLSIAAYTLLARGVGVDTLFAPHATPARTEQVLLMLEEPLRLFAVNAQASARLWTRNGTSLLFLLMLFTHGNIVLIRNMFFALQLAAAVLPPDVFVETYLAHMISGVIDGNNSEDGNKKKEDEEKEEEGKKEEKDSKGTIPAALFTEALATLVTVATDKTLLPNVTPEESGKRLVVQMLANKKQASFAGIAKALTTSDRTIPWLEDYIRTVADYTPPRGSRDGAYKLKPAVLEHFAPYSTFYFGVATAEYEELWTAFQRRARRRGTAPTPPCPARADFPTGDFAGLPRVLNTAALWDFVCRVLESPAVADFTDRTYVVLCHLLQLGLHEGVTLSAMNDRHKKTVVAFLENAAASESNEHAKTLRALAAELSGRQEGTGNEGAGSTGKSAAMSKMELAKQKQREMLAAMKKKQALLLQHMEDGMDESDEDDAEKGGRRHEDDESNKDDSSSNGEPVAKKKNGACDECCEDDLNSCVLCHEDAGDLGYIGMVQFCSLPLFCATTGAGAWAKEGREARRGEDGGRLPFQVALDPVLTTCHHKVHARCFRAFAASQEVRAHGGAFLCPACRQLSNAVVSPHADFFPALCDQVAKLEPGSANVVFLRVLTATLLHRELVLRDTCPVLDSAASCAAALKEKDAGFLRCVLRCAVEALPRAQADTVLGFFGDTRRDRAAMLHTAAQIDPFFHAVSLVVALLRQHTSSIEDCPCNAPWTTTATTGAGTDPLLPDRTGIALLFAQHVVRVLVCAPQPALRPDELATVVSRAMTASTGTDRDRSAVPETLLLPFARQVFLLLHVAGMLPAGASASSFGALATGLGLAAPKEADVAALAGATAAHAGELHFGPCEPFSLHQLPGSFTELMVHVRAERARWGCPAAHAHTAVCVGCGSVFCRDCVSLPAMYQHADRCLGCLLLLNPDDQTLLASATDHRRTCGLPFIYQDCHGASHLTGLPLYLSPERTQTLRDNILHLTFNNMLCWRT